MPDEIGRFRVSGPSWDERSTAGELGASLSPGGSIRWNLFLHGITIYASSLIYKYISKKSIVVDFGCGTGRMVRHFATRVGHVFGLDISQGMLNEATKFGKPNNCQFIKSDGIHIPLDDGSVDLIWCSGVLRFSLLVDDPAYDQIAKEMQRVLKPGGIFINCEVYLDRDESAFIPDYVDAGFDLIELKFLQKYQGPIERIAQSKCWPLSWVPFVARLSAAYRVKYSDVKKSHSGLRDYVFIWRKK